MYRRRNSRPVEGEDTVVAGNHVDFRRRHALRQYLGTSLADPIQASHLRVVIEWHDHQGSYAGNRLSGGKRRGQNRQGKQANQSTDDTLGGIWQGNPIIATTETRPMRAGS